MLNLRRLQQGILPLEGECVSFCLAALLQTQRKLSGLKNSNGRVSVTKGTSEQLYLSSFFSATLRGIALSIRTRSLADRFCRLFTRRSLFEAVTHRRGHGLFSGSPPPPPPVTLASTHHQCRHCPSRCGGPWCSAGSSERRFGWKVGSAGAVAASSSCCNIGRWWLLCCGLRSGVARAESSDALVVNKTVETKSLSF